MSDIQRVKYPRTYHLPWSPGATSDDKMHSQEKINEMFKGYYVVVTEKLDGECTTIYSDGYCHARSVDSKHHVTRSFVKNLAANIAPLMTFNKLRVVGENMFAQHSIAYNSLPGYFIVFSLMEDNIVSTWRGIENFAEEVKLPLAPVLYYGPWDEEKVKACYTGVSKFGGEQEGYVVRTSHAFIEEHFSDNVAKYVRANHVKTEHHWMHEEIIKNKLSEE